MMSTYSTKVCVLTCKYTLHTLTPNLIFIQVFLGFVDKDFKNQPAIILELSMALAAALYEKVSFSTLLDLFVYECLCINFYGNICFFQHVCLCNCKSFSFIICSIAVFLHWHVYTLYCMFLRG